MPEREDEGTILDRGYTVRPVANPSTWLLAPLMLGLVVDMGLILAATMYVVLVDGNPIWIFLSVIAHLVLVGMNVRDPQLDNVVRARIESVRLPRNARRHGVPRARTVLYP